MIKGGKKKPIQTHFPIPIHHGLFHLSDLCLFQSKVKLILHIPHIFAIISFHKHFKLRLFYNIQNKEFRFLKAGFNTLAYFGISV